MKPHVGELTFFFALFAVVGFFAFMIMQPYFTALFLAGVFTVMFLPVFERLKRSFKGSRSMASLATVLIVLFVFLVPLSFVGYFLFDELRNIYLDFNEGASGILLIQSWTAAIEQFVQRLIPGFTIDIDVYAYAANALTWAGQHFSVFFAGLFGFIFDIFLIIIAMFFFYRDGDKLKAFALKWSPLADSYDESIIAKIELAVSSVVKGALTTASVQGLLVGTGFTIFGVPNPVLWGVVATVAALVPLVGTTIVTIPAVAYLIFMGNPLFAVLLLLWAIFCVGLSDNFLNPMLIKRGVHIHSFLILLSVFGGLVYFGPIGFLVGPIVMAFLFALLDIYPAVMKGRAIDVPSGQ